jgi:hypothetical protein
LRQQNEVQSELRDEGNVRPWVLLVIVGREQSWVGICGPEKLIELTYQAGPRRRF